MATLHKFKILATQCGVTGSPTRSPTTSPVIHLRRRKTLRMLLGRGGGGEARRLPSRCDDGSPDGKRSSKEGISPERGKELSVRHKLKDLFVSSPPAFGEKGSENVRDGLLQSGGGSGGVRRGGTRLLRPLSATLRQRLLRRAWRPMLVAIPE